MEPASSNQSVAMANDWPQHAASWHILPKLAAITIKGALLQDEGPWFFTLFSAVKNLHFPSSSCVVSKCIR